jgi:hypothetical protein
LTASILYNVFKISNVVLGLFRKKQDKNTTKCKECGLELHDPEKLKRHLKKAMGMYLKKNLMRKVDFLRVECGKLIV